MAHFRVWIGRLGLRLARSRGGRFFIATAVRHLHRLLPVQRLYESDHLLAFAHPQPSYPIHILLVPKQAYASLLDIPPTAAFWPDLLHASQQLVAQLQLGAGYRLIVNGGRFQDVPVVHFHLVGEPEP